MNIFVSLKIANLSIWEYKDQKFSDFFKYFKIGIRFSKFITESLITIKFSTYKP